MSNGGQLELAGWVVLAMALGALIGAEREYRGHEAGVRTSALVCAGSAIFGQLSFQLFESDRIAAGVVQGIGFLGGGLIFQRGGGIAGVTTAATVWVIAAIGLLLGAELWLAAIALAAATVVLLELTPLSDWVYRRGKAKRSAVLEKLGPEKGDGNAPAKQA